MGPFTDHAATKIGGAIVSLLLAVTFVGCKNKETGSRATESANVHPQEITYYGQIAPLVWEKCAGCHRLGESAPFSLLTYRDVAKRSQQILEVTAKGVMPPWMPERDGTFKGERSLSSEQLALLQHWVEQGALEGDEKTAPKPPTWSEGWQLGQPDLVLEMPKEYVLAAEGPDQYRNFVVPCPISTNAYVKAVEFRPETRAVHHAFIKIDRTGQSRSLEGKDGQPGFAGIHGSESAQMPEGQLLTWQPGKMASASPDGCWWLLEPNTDFVFQLHLQPFGKREPIRPRLGIYFTSERPSRRPFKLHLVSYKIDIPAGASTHVVEESMMLPCDLELLRILPHAHFLATRIEADATAPGGEIKLLIRIPHWDFNWQGDYEYDAPIFLTKGTVVRMRFTYDNSTNNTHNVFHPPQRVMWGPASTNEMAELWLQVLPRNPSEGATLSAAQQAQDSDSMLKGAEMRLQSNPDDFQANIKLGLLLINKDQLTNALAHFEQAVRTNPQSDSAQYYRALALRRLDRVPEAIAGFETVLHLNPNNGRAHGNLAAIFAESGDLLSARRHVSEALRLNPQDPIAQELNIFLEKAGK